VHKRQIYQIAESNRIETFFLPELECSSVEAAKRQKLDTLVINTQSLWIIDLAATNDTTTEVDTSSDVKCNRISTRRGGRQFTMTCVINKWKLICQLIEKITQKHCGLLEISFSFCE